MGKRAIVVLLAIVAAVSVCVVALPGLASEEPSNAPSIAEQRVEIAELQQQIDSQGYNYTVAENAITRLSPEERQLLSSYKPLRSPAEPLTGNIRFRSLDEIPRAGMVMQSSVEQLPSSYDAMALGYVTPVRNQGGCGSCWIFAVTADFESDVLINESLAFNFAEQEVGDCNIWSRVGGYDFCDGGVDLMAINRLTKYGAADEACHPYVARSQTCRDCTPLETVNNWRGITDDYGESEITLIKNAILNYGPVFATIYVGDPGFSAYNSGVYEYWGYNVPNHAVEIIGWNDALQHSHGSGAWLIKNSWGTTWGAAGPYPGCAWVAYGSANLGDWASAIAGYEDINDKVIFYHDECGWMWYVWGCGEPTAYGAVRFVPSQNVTLTAVDFWAAYDEMAYEIEIFDTLHTYPSYYTFSDQLATTQTGKTTEWGYYSIPLDTPVELEEGDDFIVQINFTKPRYGHPIPIDYYTESYLPPWSEVATFSGESYWSCVGLQFVKPYYSGYYYDIGIRTRAEVPNQPPAAIIDAITPDPAEQVADTVSFTGHGTDTDGTVVAYNWSSSMDGPLSTSASFTKPASELSLGTHTISFRVQDDDGAWSTAATENVTVIPFNLTRVFDTGAGTYPSISGIHNGTLTPTKSMIVRRLYTYPRPGTGGHSESVRIWNATWNATATWSGYSCDWHNITFSAPFILQGNETYNYSIHTGSYPQIIHAASKPVTGGTITWDSFVDINGNEHSNWILAMRLE